MSVLANLGGVCCLLLLAAGADAQSLYCSLGMGNIQFGTVDPNRAGSTTTGNMDIYCSGATKAAVRVCVSLGAPVDGKYDPRLLAGKNSQRLDYNIYTNAAYTAIWGSTGPTMNFVDIPVNYGGGGAKLTYYAKLPVQQSVPPGDYSAIFRYALDATVYAQDFYPGSAPECTTAMPIVSRFEFAVMATVSNSCSVDVSATTLDYGSIGITLSTQAVTASSTITVRCTQGVNYTLSLNAGAGAGAAVNQRHMTRTGGSERLKYELYQDAGYARMWGDGSSGTLTLSGQGSSGSQSHTVYGRIPAQPLPLIGGYRDRIVVTMTY